MIQPASESMQCEAEVVYPSQYESEVLLRDGTIIKLRPIRRDDTDRWLAFVSRLSPQDLYVRFHYVPKEFKFEEALWFCSVDYKNSFAFVAEVHREQRDEIVGIGRYYRLPDKHSAEIAWVIEGVYQRRGLGTLLTEQLANVARENDITTFEADVLAENEPMMAVLRDYGFHIIRELEAGLYHVTFRIARTRRVAKKEEERMRISTVASLHPVLSPRSVAVIGASRKPGSIGQLLLQRMLQSGFSGVVYPVNPNTEAVLSIKAYPSVLDVPGDIDLAVIAVPAQFVAKVADECGRKGLHAMIVISDGFRETGPEGASRERDLRDIALGYGMRLVGPNCMGLINTDPDVNLNATFSPFYPPRGNVAFLSQSGGLGLAILEYAHRIDVGISTFVSVGNRADVSPNDLLQYWEKDMATKVILLYLESIGNPRSFGRIARRVSATKPIVAIKGGSTLAGSRAAASHTGAMATPEAASDALFRQTGIIRVNALEDLLSVASLLSHQPVPKGKRVVIVTNGGGPGILAADACEDHGLVLSEFSPETLKQLETIGGRRVALRNPLDLTAGAGEEDFEKVLNILARDNGNDAVITIFIPATLIDTTGMEDVIRRTASVFQRLRKPLLACFMGQQDLKSKLGSSGKFVPSYTFPEDAVSSLARVAEYGEWVRKPKGVIPKFRGIKRERAQKLIEKILTRSLQRPLWLSTEELVELLKCYGIRIVESLFARTATEAADRADQLNFPVAIKLSSSTILHKTEVGGVVLDVKSKTEAEKAFSDIYGRLAEMGRQQEMEGVTLQPMIKGGIETIVGVKQDPSFGPLMMFGIGGIYTELLHDFSIRLHPLTDLDAREMVGSIRMANLLKGFRSLPPGDIPAVEELLLRLSAMVEDVPQITELDFNPVKVLPPGEGCWIVDARIAVR